jgi:anti-sigma regulatory factor (Ser/Thr protein kinase)
MSHTAATVPIVSSPGVRGLRHELLAYDDLVGYVSATSAFVREGLEAGESVLVVVPAPHLEALAVALLGQTGDLRFIDVATVGANPGRIIDLWRTFLDSCDGRPARGVGEPVGSGGDSDQLAEWGRHERLLNLALADRPFRLLCPYDGSAVEPAVIADAETAHPFTHGADHPNQVYGADGLLSGLFDEPLTAPPDDHASLAFGRHDLARLRRFVSEQAASAGLDEAAAGDLVLAADEIGANCVIHGGGGGTVRCWPEDGRVICQLESGGTFTDPLAGRVCPRPEAPGGRGLWLANQLCDLVQLRNTSEGNVVRLRSRRNPG